MPLTTAPSVLTATIGWRAGSREGSSAGSGQYPKTARLALSDFRPAGVTARTSLGRSNHGWFERVVKSDLGLRIELSNFAYQSLLGLGQLL